MKLTYRLETDSMGKMQVPASAYYGAQTARAVENFPISGLRFSRGFISALGLIKKNTAETNLALGLLSPKIARAIHTASNEVIAGKWDSQFVVDIFQTGSGTSTNMNANEVIANRAIELLGGKRGDKSVHPNDHVNLGQSSNDVIPTAIHLAALEGLMQGLLPALETLHDSLARKARQFHAVLKIGRTHLQDATPIRLGQEFSGYASQVEQGIERLQKAALELGEVALGGTAVGTGINTHRRFSRRVLGRISKETGIKLREARNHFEAQGALDRCVSASGALKCLAIGLVKIANDIRWLGSGPRCGLGEIQLPATQPGSSIMPGKVNPVMCEMVIQVCAQVIGNDATIGFAATQGAFELNTMLPVVAFNLLQSIAILASASEVFAKRCVAGLEANVEKCSESLEKSLAMSTALVPAIGYDRAAKISRTAYEQNRNVRDVAREVSGVNERRLNRLLDPRRQVGP